MANDDILKIECPKCGKFHWYELEIRRSEVYYRRQPEPEELIKEFTRLFTCPIKNEEFQAEFKIQDHAGNEIRSLAIKGIIEKHSQKKK